MLLQIFKGAILHEANLELSYLASANFANADLTSAKLSSEYPYDVYYNNETAFNPKFNPEAMGWKKL